MTSQASSLAALSVGDCEGFGASLTELASAPHIDRMFDKQCVYTPNTDSRTQGALLFGRIARSYSGLLAYFDLMGFDLVPVFNGQVRFTDKEYGSSFSQIQFALAECLPTSGDPLSPAQHYKDVMETIAQHIFRRSKLSRGACWRLATDEFTDGYLAVAKGLGCVEQGMKRATQLIKGLGSPVDNPQWHYKQFHCESGSNATWFRVRGGCCRFYNLPEGSLCSTCLHLDDAERTQRFASYLSSLGH